MMLISRNIRQKLTVLALGTSLFAGCSSGPQLSSIRLWPGSGKLESAADDEAVAKKWRDRLNASALSNGPGSAPGIETAEADAPASKPRSSRFNIFRRFSREEAAEETNQTAAITPQQAQQRLNLERRIAELEAEQKALQQQQQQRATANHPAAAPAQRTGAEVNDPFLAAAQMQDPNTRQIVRPAIRPAPQPPAAQSTLPDWAQSPDGANNSAAPPVTEVAKTPQTNSFTPGFDQSLNRLEAEAQRQARAETPEGTAPAMPFPSEPVIRPRDEQPIARAAQKSVPVNSVASAPAPAAEPKLDRPVSDPDTRQHLSSLRSAEEQQQIWAHLEVQQLLKRARIQARAGELNEALATAVAAEQLANSAKIHFDDREQTPAQLVSLIRLKAEETPATAAAQPRQDTPPSATHPITQTPPAIVSREDRAKLNVRAEVTPHPLNRNVSTRPVSPPQWTSAGATEPRQVIAENPLVSTPVRTAPAAHNRDLKTADFVHPEPAQSAEPYRSTSDQWYTTGNHSPTKTSPSSGGYIEAAVTPRTTRNEINAQFVSSTTIYSPENLQWTRIDESRATIRDDLVPAPPAPGLLSRNSDELPPFAAASQPDPFAGVLEHETISSTQVTSKDPLTTLIPESSADEAAPAVSSELHILGIPARKLGLVLLAGLILLAAIIHRRRTSELHEIM